MLAALLDLYACALVGYIYLNWFACGLARMYERSDLLAALFALLVTGLRSALPGCLRPCRNIYWGPRLDPGSRRDWIRTRHGELISCDSSRDDVWIYYKI